MRFVAHQIAPHSTSRNKFLDPRAEILGFVEGGGQGEDHQLPTRVHLDDLSDAGDALEVIEQLWLRKAVVGHAIQDAKETELRLINQEGVCDEPILAYEWRSTCPSATLHVGALGADGPDGGLHLRAGEVRAEVSRRPARDVAEPNAV